jgi:hypothetical protein
MSRDITHSHGTALTYWKNLNKGKGKINFNLGMQSLYSSRVVQTTARD